MTRCEMCGYYWQEEDEEYSACHYFGPAGWAPCEENDDEDEDDGYWEGDVGIL